MIKDEPQQKLLDFSDLEFKDHANQSMHAVQARLDLGNGFEVSVIASKDGGQGIYGDVEDNLYEIAIYDKNGMIPLSPTDDVAGWQNPAQVSALMAKAQVEGSVWVDELIEDKEEFRRDLGLDY